LLNKVVLEYIPRYGQQLADEVHKWGMWIKEQAEKELAEFYPKDLNGAIPIAYIWARTITCEGPGCGVEIPLLRSLWLAKKDTKSVGLRIIPNVHEKRVDFEIIQEAKTHDVNEGTVRRGSAICPICGYTTPVTSVRKQLKKRFGGTTDARLITVVIRHPTLKGRFYRIPTNHDLNAISKASVRLKQLQIEHTEILSLIPNEKFSGLEPRRIPLPQYGITGFEDLFTLRQALTLTTLARLVREIPTKLSQNDDQGLAHAIQTCLAFAVDKSVDQMTSLVRWASTLEVVTGTFGRQALPMLWDFVEPQPFAGAGADFGGAVDWIYQVCTTESSFSRTIGQVELTSATSHPLPDNSAHAFITDPPYYYSIPYSDLSDLFYVWLRRTLFNIHPTILNNSLTPKDLEIVQNLPHSAVAHLQKSKVFYEEHMQKALEEGERITGNLPESPVSLERG
jgi:putative DNA methylase